MFRRFRLLYLAMFAFVGSVICLQMFLYSTLQCLHLLGLQYVYKFSFTLPCNVYICWVCNMFKSFHLLQLAMFVFVGSVIGLHIVVYSTLQCLHLLGL